MSDYWESLKAFLPAIIGWTAAGFLIAYGYFRTAKNLALDLRGLKIEMDRKALSYSLAFVSIFGASFYSFHSVRMEAKNLSEVLGMQRNKYACVSQVHAFERTGADVGVLFEFGVLKEATDGWFVVVDELGTEIVYVDTWAGLPLRTDRQSKSQDPQISKQDLSGKNGFRLTGPQAITTQTSRYVYIETKDKMVRNPVEIGFLEKHQPEFVERLLPPDLIPIVGDCPRDFRFKGPGD